jgi:NAD-dependent deacetylase
MMCLACEHDWEIGLTAWRAGEDACPMCKSTSDVKPAIVFFHERAPAYVDLYQTLDSLRPSDVLLVIGTSGYVLPVGEFARWTPGFSVLNNLEPSEHIEESCFDHVLYQPASTAVPDIEAILQRRL